VSETISNALGRAQGLAFTVFSAVLIVFVVVQASRDENSSALTRADKEFTDVNLVATRGDNVIREIRRYILAKVPPSVSEQQALQNIRFSFFHAHEQAGQASARLLSAFKSGVSLDLIRQVNEDLTPMREIYGAIVSVNVDLSPQSVVLLDRLENMSFRDLSVMAHLVSIDPIGVDEAVSAFNKNWNAVAPAEAAQLLADKLKKLSAERSTSFKQIGAYGEDLRQACERFGTDYSSLAAGGLQSSNTRALATLTALQDKREALRDKLSGSFQISVPVVDQTLPAPVVTLLLPLSLVAGYGMIATALLFVRRHLKAMTGGAARKAAADNGFIFDQLYTGSPLARLLNWALLGAITLVPLAAAGFLAFQFLSAFPCWAKVLATAFMLIAIAVIAVIFQAAHEISRQAAGRD